MKSWRQDAEYFLKNKIYWLVLGMTSLGSYGYLVTHATVGIDDTPYHLYFTEGLSAYVGRWLLFVLGKVVHMGDFAPFLTDLAGVLLLTAAALVLCVLLRHILKDSVPFYGYLFFACFLVANPLWAEVFVYFLHNGVGLGYLLMALGLCLLVWGQEEGKKRGYVAATLLLWLSIGCYESLMVAWLVGFLLILAMQRYAGGKGKVFFRLLQGAGVMVGAVVLRSLWLPVVKLVFGLEGLREVAGTRSMGEMLGWLTDAQKRTDFMMAIKRTYVMYGVFAFAYYPIALFVLGALVLLAVGLWHSIRRREGWTLFLTVAALGSCFLLVPIEGKATVYRAAQFLPLVSAFGALLFCRVLEGSLGTARREDAAAKGRGGADSRETGTLSKRRGGCRGWKASWPGTVRGLAVVVLSVMTLNQCLDLNKWFYIDDLKYQAARETAGQVSYELRKGFDTSKPVIFTGIYKIPDSILAPAYVPYGTNTYRILNGLAGIVDPTLLGKFQHSQGVWVAQAPIFSVIEWGRTAFDNNQEVANFFAMHGYSIVPTMDLDAINRAQEYAVQQGFPHFPARGSIVDMGDYLIVNF